MRQPLIDSDILLYEVGFAAETGWQGDGYVQFDYVAELLDNRIANICGIVEATEPPILYLTGKGNFRYDIAKRTPYKDRPSNKPWHYKNIKAYIKGKYDHVESEGMEADDLMALEQTRRPGETIICSRDKDLRAVPGWQYGWELGNQPQFGPTLVDTIGKVSLSGDRKKIIGYGGLFFYAQCLTGDTVDSIPGLGGKTGPVKAFNILDGTTTLEEAFKRVLEAYRGLHGDRAEVELLEQGRLLHMTRHLHPDGSPVLWRFPNG
jgi:hypothetical protein